MQVPVDLRPPAADELAGVHAVIAARDQADFGRSVATIDDLRGEWQAEAFTLGHDARVAVGPGAEILGYAHIGTRGAVVAIPPAHEGRGIGTRILEWIEARERELGRIHHEQRVAAPNHGAAAFLAAHGYGPIRSYLRMARPLGPGEESRSATGLGGVTVREIERERDAVALHAVDDAAFSSASDYVPETLSRFRQFHLELPDFDAAASLSAYRGDRIVGFLLARRWPDQQAGFVDVLGVHPDEHRRGIGTLLLRSALAVWTAAGLRQAQLDVSSENPVALRLYERLGLTPLHRYDIWRRAGA